MRSLTGPGLSDDDYMLISLSSWRGPLENVNHRFISAPFVDGVPGRVVPQNMGDQ